MTNKAYVIAVSLLFPIQAFCAPASDFDSDNSSDQAYVSIDSGSGALTWGARLSSNSSNSTIGSFGENGDNLILGNWEGTGPNIGVITQLNETQVRWKIIKGDSSEASYDLGKPSDLFMSGGDFNGSGALDLVVVSQVGNALTWTVVADPFKAGGGAVTTFNLGNGNSQPFFFNPRGSADYAAIYRSVTAAGVSRKSIRGRSLSGVKFKSVLMPKSVSGLARPLPLRLSNGKDVLVFVRQAVSATGIILVRPTGRILKRITIPLTGTLIVGDFQPGGDEEILVTDSVGTGIYVDTSGNQTSITTPTGVPVDEINLNSFSGGSNPGVCEVGDPTDGSGKFVWKPNSDTQNYAVAVLPGRFTGNIDEVQLETLAGDKIESLRYKGLGNPDSEGLRSNWISRIYTGQSLRTQYGTVVLRVIFSDGDCLFYQIDNPAIRYD